MIFHLFEYPEETDDKVDAIHDQPNAHQNDQDDLVIADPVAYATFVAPQIPERTRGSRELIVP